MSVMPQRDWIYAEQRSRQVEGQLLRSMTPQQRLAIYEDMFDVFWQARQTTAGDWEKLEQWRWREKVATRQRMVEAYKKWDQRRHGPAAAENFV